jgi:hypothetical protein
MKGVGVGVLLAVVVTTVRAVGIWYWLAQNATG